MTVMITEGVAAALMYLVGGALVLFIYEAYNKTRQRSLIYMGIGFFTIIFGANLMTLSEALQSGLGWTMTVDPSVIRTIALAIQLIGIVLLIFSAIRPFRRKE
jgi:hypothetical protein